MRVLLRFSPFPQPYFPISLYPAPFHHTTLFVRSFPQPDPPHRYSNMNLSPYSPRGNTFDSLTGHLSTRRLVPRHPPQDLFLVLTPKSRERINNEVQGRMCGQDRRNDEPTRFPLLTHPKSPSVKANLLRWWCMNDELIRSAERFNEPIGRRKGHRKVLQKMMRLPREELIEEKGKVKTCTQTCQTEFPPDTKKWSIEDLWDEVGFGSSSIPMLPVIDQSSWSSDDPESRD